MNTTLIRAFAAAGLIGLAAAQIPECNDVKTTESGLQSCVLQEGEGEPPTATDKVEVHYTGWLTNGTKFDSSRDRGQPAQFALNQVIKGWTEGLQLMKPGARYKFIIPPKLGYGSQDKGKIPPDSTLVFEVELLKVFRMPKLPPAAKAEQQKKLPSGCTYSVVREGTGEKPADGKAAAFRWALFQPDGVLLDCSERRDDFLMSGTKDMLELPFLRDLYDVMRTGEVVRVEVPNGKVQGLGQDTVWRVELEAVNEVPKFRALDPEKTVTTQSGLKYEVLEPGTGKAPKAIDTVSAHYTGWLTDGTLFDSSHARGTPTEFPLSGVIRGWTEGLQLMKEGGTFLFEIPGELAYGPRGMPPKIGPNATLVFLVTLAKVK